MDALARHQARDLQRSPASSRPGAFLEVVPDIATRRADAPHPETPAPARSAGPRTWLRGLRTPPGVWRWRETVAVAAAVLLLLVIVVAVDPLRTSAPDVARRSAVVSCTIVFLASVLIYLSWRLAGGESLAWISLGVSAWCVQTLALAGLAAADPARVDGRPAAVLITQLVATLVVVLAVRVARRWCSTDPLATGIALGIVLFVGRYAALFLTPHMGLSEPTLTRLTVIALALDIGIAIAIAAFPIARRWIRYRIALALAVLAVAHTVAYARLDHLAFAATAIVCNVVGATILFSLAFALLRVSIRESRGSIILLGTQLARAEEVKRAEQAQLHEIRATIAGISSAARVISNYHAVAPGRREAISEMIDAELSRLERLVRNGTNGAVEEIELDRALEPLVVRLQVQGRCVQWEPSGLRVLGNADDVAEIVNILLMNSVRHGDGTSIALRARTTGPNVEITVSDGGPGVPAELRNRIFEWGASRPGSTGDGIGLQVARQLTTELGGTLVLDDVDRPGATFIVSLPGAR